jgi:hypothetical protein
MAIAGYEITLATQADIPAIIDLQERNLRSNGGTLSVPFSCEWFEAAIADMPIVVARSEGLLLAIWFQLHSRRRPTNPSFKRCSAPIPALTTLTIMGRSA